MRRAPFALLALTILWPASAQAAITVETGSVGPAQVGDPPGSVRFSGSVSGNCFTPNETMKVGFAFDSVDSSYPQGFAYAPDQTEPGGGTVEISAPGGTGMAYGDHQMSPGRKYFHIEAWCNSDQQHVKGERVEFDYPVEGSGNSDPGGGATDPGGGGTTDPGGSNGGSSLVQALAARWFSIWEDRVELTGDYDTGGAPATCWFDVGTQTDFLYNGSYSRLGEGEDSCSSSGKAAFGPVEVDGLEAGTAYHYRFVVEDEAGQRSIMTGDDFVFQTVARGLGAKIAGLSGLADGIRVLKMKKTVKKGIKKGTLKLPLTFERGTVTKIKVQVTAPIDGKRLPVFGSKELFWAVPPSGKVTVPLKLTPPAKEEKKEDGAKQLFKQISIKGALEQTTSGPSGETTIKQPLAPPKGENRCGHVSAEYAGPCVQSCFPPVYRLEWYAPVYSRKSLTPRYVRIDDCVNGAPLLEF